MPTVQNKAFPLAGLMYANVNVWSKAARRQIFTNLGVFGTSTHAHECEAGITAPANASSSFSRRGGEESFETSTRTREGEFLESRKKGLPTIANPVYGYSAPAKSGAGIGVLQLSTAHNRAKCGFFGVRRTATSFNGGLGEGIERCAGICGSRYANLVQFTTSDWRLWW